ncbi:NUDIX hydrolase [Chachezhania antarctica]|uniref:NUDIX hydrolase n=1 Tax=Chachezhania antarctica TaxID=2340860 RepID=UPI000EB106FB|nr:NUDIX domain-containing protein [Chachezhania antarctica]|tara:strand:+ start:5556 stop:6497 length:942 start_codon:yes stop_codon:yes gene_type:complete
MSLDLILIAAGPGKRRWDGAEEDRPLRNRGKRMMQRLGSWMGEKGLAPDATIAATFEYARTSAEKALKAGGNTAQAIEDSSQVAVDALATLRRLREDGDPCKTLLVVARPEDLTELAGLCGATWTVDDFPPGRLRILRLPTGAPLRPGVAELVKTLDSSELPDDFPFPDFDGPERRPRPAYYYRQSAVIPYCTGPDGPQILLISSSSGDHWLVPKGIHEPGLGAEASAAIEAQEEAGVVGDAGAEPLGSYLLDKWGGTCTVAVYPLEVTEMLEPPEWEEHHRERRWVPAEEAAEMLAVPDLRAIVARFAASLG